MKVSKLIRTAEFWDIIGLVVWVFLAGVSIFCLNTGQPANPSVNGLILAISIAGLIVDGTMVYLRFFKGK